MTVAPLHGAEHPTHVMRMLHEHRMNAGRIATLSESMAAEVDQAEVDRMRAQLDAMNVYASTLWARIVAAGAGSQLSLPDL